MKAPLFRLLGTTLSLALSGCGVDSVKVQSASNVSLAAGAVVTQASAELDEAQASRAMAYTYLIASDPSCSLQEPVSILDPLTPTSGKKRRVPICANPVGKVPPGYRVETLHYEKIGANKLKPTLLLIAAVAEYGSALSEITKRPDDDISTILNSALAKATEARTIAQSLGVASFPNVPGASSDQVVAAKSIIQFLDTIIMEANKAKDIGAVFAKHGHEIDGLLDPLSTQITTWSSTVTQGYTLEQTNLLKTAYENQKKAMTFEGRIAFIQLYQKSQDDGKNVATTASAFSEAIKTLKATNNDLNAVLSGHPTDAQRQQAAQVNEQRIINALQLVSNAAVKWGVL